MVFLPNSYVWTCMDMYGYVWTCMDMYGHVWTCMDMSEMMSDSTLSREKKWHVKAYMGKVAVVVVTRFTALSPYITQLLPFVI